VSYTGCSAADSRYADPEVALNTGMILKEMLRYEALAKILLYSDECVHAETELTQILLVPKVH
jgi:hypothetical protein